MKSNTNFFSEKIPEETKARPHDEDILEKVYKSKNGANFRRLWEGDIYDYQSHREADFAMCFILSAYTTDPKQIDRLYRNSNLYRAIWDKKHSCEGLKYGEMTIKTALAKSKNRQRAKPESYKSRAIARFPSLVDLVLDEGNVSFLCKTNQGIEITRSHIDSSGQEFNPPNLDRIPFRLVEAQSVLKHIGESDECLYWDVFNVLNTVSILPSEKYYHLATVYVFFTYLPEAVSYYPYLWFFGLPERGKSRIVKALINLSYRGLYTETLNQAFIFRFAHRFSGTIGFDVYDLVEQAKKKNSYDLLLGRCERGMVVPRVLNIERQGFEDTTYFEVSGPTILATNVELPLKDPLRSRCIQIVMPEARDRYPNNNTPEFLSGLKTRLITFRGRHLGKKLPEVEKPVAGRLGDITQPLLCVAKLLPEEASAKIRELIEDLERERKDEQRDTLAGQIVRALYELHNKVEGGRLRVEKVVKAINQNTIFYSAQAVGRELTTLGIKKIKSNGVMHILWDSRMIERLWVRYGVSELEAP